jgi:predicted transposase YdaD
MGRRQGRKVGREEGRERGREEGIEIGVERGIEKGILITRIEMIVRRVKRGLDLPAIADALDMDQETIRPIWEAVREAAPEYDQDEILRKLLPERNHA